MTEMIKLTGSRIAAVSASVVLQTAYHLYQGALNVAMIAVVFLMMSIYFAKTRRIAPIILVHLIMDMQVLLRLSK